MPITFRKKTNTGVKKNTPLKLKLESLFGKKLNSTQVNRIQSEILKSGFVTSENNITDKALQDYAKFKTCFPKYIYKKDELEKAKEITKTIEHDDYIYSAENIFYKIKELLPGLADSTIYYWFEKAGSKFSTVKSYGLDITVLVMYQAVRRKETLFTGK
ncbi:hypothetical protein NIES2100_05080 [Calothrix sp. NIES-2100]|uniref:hypothetical protein n=1 Tax=Calothrix sp. NIES-2100 TaxID=1954172 RepID=UPI000B609CB4|nr:hypothetical protein NIES2100_05080 [Calothrix sp. NIES-2100]